MHIIDWIFILADLFLVFWIGVFTKKYVKSVADSMPGGPVAGHYLLAVTHGPDRMAQRDGDEEY